MRLLLLCEMNLVKKTRILVRSNYFQNFITFIIILSGIMVGLETYPSISASYLEIFDFLDLLFILIFTTEIFLKIFSHGKKFWKFFYDPWNLFDFFIVAIALLPIHAEFITVLRLLRILRILRLVRFLPKLQMIVGALLKSIPSMGYIGLLLFLMFYMYAVAGVFLFSQNDPFHFKDLQTTFLTLFKVVTMEGWIDILHIQMYGCTNYYTEDYLKEYCKHPEQFPLISPFYFITFILFGTMIILNLFIGVILKGMEEAQAQRQIEDSMGESKNFDLALEKEIQQLEQQMFQIQENLERLKYLTKRKLRQ